MAYDGDVKIWLTQARKNGCWKIRWIDPATGQVRQRSARTNTRRSAERQLGELRAELIKGLYRHTSRISWSKFRRRYDDQVISAWAVKTRLKIDTVFNAVEKLVSPRSLADLNAERISLLQAKLREGGCAESTIAGYLADLRAASLGDAEMGYVGGGAEDTQAAAGEEVERDEGPSDYAGRVS